MSEIGVPLALGGVALLAAAGVVASRSGSAATRLSVFDGITRHSPEGLWFKRYAETYGFPAAVEWRRTLPRS